MEAQSVANSVSHSLPCKIVPRWPKSFTTTTTTIAGYLLFSGKAAFRSANIHTAKSYEQTMKQHTRLKNRVSLANMAANNTVNGSAKERKRKRGDLLCFKRKQRKGSPPAREARKRYLRGSIASRKRTEFRSNLAVPREKERESCFLASQNGAILAAAQQQQNTTKRKIGASRRRGDK